MGRWLVSESPLAWVDEHIEGVLHDVLTAEQDCQEPTEHLIYGEGHTTTIYDVARVLERLMELAQYRNQHVWGLNAEGEKK